MFYIIGLFVVLRFLLKVYYFFSERRFYFEDSKGDLSKYAANDGYAVITGATGGLGKKISEHLASQGGSFFISGRVTFYLDLQYEPHKGINLFMIDLNEKALALACEEFGTKYQNIKIVTKRLDLTSLSDESIYDKLEQELS